MSGSTPSDAHRRSVDAAFWLAATALIGIKLVLGSDLSVQMNISPHDDSMYVERAYHLLHGEAFGPYNSRILVKYPGISLWLAGTRSLGIPFLLSVNALYVAAGLYLAMAFRRCGIASWIALTSLALHLLNPITYGYEWIRVIREPLDTALLTLIAAAILQVYGGIHHGRAPWVHLSVLAPAFAFSLFVREDDRLLWLLLALFIVGLVWQVFRGKSWSRAMLGFVISAALLPAGLGKAYEYGLRAFVEREYGLPILHELGEGEFPRLLAAIRSIDAVKDNRMVMVPQETLAKLHAEIPAFRPVIEKLPPPGPGTQSCTIHGVCSEWSNGWMPFWIKDSAYSAGRTPNLPAAQEYFQRIRNDIERACATRKLQCTEKGESLVPPMQLRWTRAYVGEAWRLAKMALKPDPHVVGELPVTYDLPVELGRKFQAVTMTDHFDTQWQTSYVNIPAKRLYASPLAGWRHVIAGLYQFLAVPLILAMLVALALRLWWSDTLRLGPVALTTAVLGIYSLLRFAALSYVAVFMGPFDPRMMFSTYALMTVFALSMLFDAGACFIVIRRGADKRK